jgi:2,3-bisphosphoglycerate-independent phosphoglycerate mutase
MVDLFAGPSTVALPGLIAAYAGSPADQSGPWSFSGEFNTRGAFASDASDVGPVLEAAGLDRLDPSDLSDFAGIGRTVIDAIDSYPFLLVHVTAAGECARQHDWAGCIEVLERIDGDLVATLLDSGQRVAALTITTGWSTLPVSGQPLFDLAPVVMWGPGIRPDGTRKFTEAACSTGALNRLQPRDIPFLLLDQLGLVKKFEP